MKEFQVKSKSGAHAHESDGRPWACISIGTHDGDWPKISAVNRLGLLQIHFLDCDMAGFVVEEGDEFYRELGACGAAITEAQADQILDFVNKYWDEVDYFLVHCTAGKSRSPAVAAAITKIKGGDDSHWFRVKTPNALVYRTLLNRAFERNEIVGMPNDLPEPDGRFNV